MVLSSLPSFSLFVITATLLSVSFPHGTHEASIVLPSQWGVGPGSEFGHSDSGTGHMIVGP